MNNIFEGQWKQIKGELRSWWGKLTDDDIESIGGSKDKLIGAVQEKYGYMYEDARQEVDRRLQQYSNRTDLHGTEDMGSMLKSKAQDVASTVAETMGSMKAKAEEVASAVVSKENLEKMAGDVVELIRRYPVQSLVIGLGIGYLLARRTGR